MNQHNPVKFMTTFVAVLMMALFMNACNGGGDDGGGGPVPPTPTPVGTAARLAAITISMPTPTTILTPPPGTATGKLAVNMDTGEIAGAILYSGLMTTPTGAGIHDSTAAPGTLPIVSLVSSTTGTAGTTGAWVVPAGTILNQIQLSALAFGGLFFRLDTPFSQGEKRGDIVFPNITLTTPLTPVAGTGSPGSGTGTLTVNLGTGTISGSITFSGLTSNATEAHINLRSDNAVIATLTGGVGSQAGTFTFPAGASLNAPQLKALVNDGLYFAVHSQNFQPPVSELLGDIVYPVKTIPVVSLNGNQEVPPVNAPVSSGTGNLTVNLGTGKLSGSIAFSTPSSIADRAHIHQGFAGENGPILVTLTLQGGTPSTSGTWTVPADTLLSAAGLGALISDGLYLNVHTAGNPNGEIRGQIRNVPTN